jgi:D-alanine-D-alanine ligase
MKVGFCFNLKRATDTSTSQDRYAEWDDAETIEAVRSALARRHEVISVEGDEEAFAKFKQYRPEMVFNMAEGMYGASREAQIPALLEMLQIPYTGSDPLALAVCLDKAMAKIVLQHNGIPTPPFRVVYDQRAK